MPRVLVIDDDAELTEMLGDFLLREGFSVAVAANGPDALVALSNAADAPDLVVLDVMLPGLDGFGVLAELQAGGRFPPVLMLSARGEEEDRIAGLELGADDYMSKPFNPRELVARMRAILRRQGDASLETQDVLCIGALEIDPARLSVHVGGRVMPLTGAELRVLTHLARNIGHVVSRSDLTEVALGRSLELYDRSIDTHVSNLRRKLGMTKGADIEIRSVRGAGYQLIPPTAG
jgi:two-component system response regulator CpxR